MKTETVRTARGARGRKWVGGLLAAALLTSALGLGGSAAGAQESDYSQSFAGLQAGDSLPDGFRVGGGTVKTGDGYVEIQAGGSLLLPESVTAEDFTYEVEFTIVRANEPTRWAGFMFRYQSSGRYMQMCCRQNASATNGLDCAYNNNGGWVYPDGARGSYIRDIDPEATYTAKVMVKDGRVALYVNDLLCVLTTAPLAGSGAFGVQANGSVVRVYGVSVSAAGEMPTVLPDGSETVNNLYEAETGIVSAPTVVQKIDSARKLEALAVEGERTQVAWFTLADKALNVQVGDESRPLAEMLDACGGAVLPLFETDDAETAGALAGYMADSGRYDVMVASGSPEALAAAWEVNGALRYAYLAGAVTTENTVAQIARDTHTGGATVAVVAPGEALDREAAEYLQLRGIAVWLDSGEGSDEQNVYDAVDCGANGVTVADFSAAYDLYEKVDAGETVTIRRTFIVGHRGLPNTAPENSKEGYLEAVKAGADAIECDVNMTKDGVLVSNHNGSVDGYTTDSTATGAISSFTWEELSRYTLKQVGKYNTSQFCKMEWYFQVLKDNPSVVGYVELKNGDEAVVQKTVELMEEMGVEDQVFIISFSDSALKLVREYAPYVGTGRLASGTYNSALSVNGNLVSLMKAVGAVAGTPDYASGDFTSQLIEAGRHRGILFQNWTENSLSMAVRLHERGVDCITTDYAQFAQNESLLAYQDVSAAALFGELKGDPSTGEETKPTTTQPTTVPGGTQPGGSEPVDTGENTRVLYAAAVLLLAGASCLFLLRRRRTA